MLAKISADDILKYFSQIIGFDISYKLSPEETICMKYQSLLSWKKKMKISSVEFTQRVGILILKRL